VRSCLILETNRAVRGREINGGSGELRISLGKPATDFGLGDEHVRRGQASAPLIVDGRINARRIATHSERFHHQDMNQLGVRQFASLLQGLPPDKIRI